MFKHFLVIAALIAVPVVSDAKAQLYYNGYDIGPDYGAALNQLLEQNQRLDQEMAMAQEKMLQQVMQNPDFIHKFNEYQASGGQMGEKEYAYLYAASAGFTNVQPFVDNERDIARRNQDFMNNLIPQQ